MLRRALQLQLAHLLCTRSRIELLAGDVSAARTTLLEAGALAKTMGAEPESALGRELERLWRELTLSSDDGR